MKNLDFLCMQAAQAMAGVEGKKAAKENLATKVLGVLLENGPYGAILYLEVQKNDQRIACAFRDELIALARSAGVESTLESVGDFEQITKWLQAIANSLDTYLFVKRLWQQALTYARYHAKACE